MFSSMWGQIRITLDTQCVTAWKQHDKRKKTEFYFFDSKIGDKMCWYDNAIYYVNDI